MPKILVIGNHKGGVGKTTTAVNLAAGLARLGFRVLAVDADPQGNNTMSLIDDLAQRETSALYHALADPNSSFSAHACRSKETNLEIVPNSIKCMDWEKTAYGTMDSILGFKRLLENDPKIHDYDIVVIDTPPNLGLMVQNALMIADYVIVPIPVGDQYALDGIATYFSIMSQAKVQNKKLMLLGILLTKFDARSSTYKGNEKKIQAYFGARNFPLFETVIRINVDLDRAHTNRKSIFAHDSSKAGAVDYASLATEVAKAMGLPIPDNQDSDTEDNTKA